MAEFTYTGFAPEGVQQFADGSVVPFTRGTPVDLTADQAKAVEADGDWSPTKAKATSKKDTP